jgi:predicted ATP-dependent protease
VVFETNPTYYNLFGRIEYRVQLEGHHRLYDDKGGLHTQANGGYPIVNALDILRNIFVYDSLKRMVKNREVSMEDVWEQYLPSPTLKPAPIPVDIKLVVIGEPFIYYLLYNLDTEYRKLFKSRRTSTMSCPTTRTTSGSTRTS